MGKRTYMNRYSITVIIVLIPLFQLYAAERPVPEYSEKYRRDISDLVEKVIEEERIVEEAEEEFLQILKPQQREDEFLRRFCQYLANGVTAEIHTEVMEKVQEKLDEKCKKK
jgi:hypothetical protein